MRFPVLQRPFRIEKGGKVQATLSARVTSPDSPPFMGRLVGSRSVISSSWQRSRSLR
jgi:hypothetical protein